MVRAIWIRTIIIEGDKKWVDKIINNSYINEKNSVVEFCAQNQNSIRLESYTYRETKDAG